MDATARPTIGLVTVWYHAASAIERFADELHALEYPNLRPLFVINSLGHNDVDRLRRAVPEAIVLEPGANVGPAAAWNLATSQLLADGVEFVGLWNVDVHLHPECVGRLAAVLETWPDVGACQPLLCQFEERNRVQMFGGSVDPTTGMAYHDYKGECVSERLPAMRDAEYLDGGSMMVRARVLREVGGFDERLFMYAEDCDLSLRIRRAGYRTVAVRDARAWHEHREDKGVLPPPHEVFYRSRNRFFLVRTYASRRAWRRAVVRALAWELPRSALFYVRRGRLDLALACISGISKGLIGRFGKRGWVD